MRIFIALQPAPAFRDALASLQDRLRAASVTGRYLTPSNLHMTLAFTEADRQVITDLMDTLRANLDRCVGMAANMIGEKKRIIVFCNGPMQRIMVNPQITAKSGEYETEEGCLSLPGVRKTKRYRKITVSYQDQAFHSRMGIFEGFTAQIIQHEVDHCNGILI